ncbi:hypothetical protein Ae168Ps1_6027c [Pseudonocardia sp. Ae168_Ps1]|nr:hypothetical protein Ae168Ps1_6027c [Pseudonocardia sp. Ae168_Ps1]
MARTPDIGGRLARRAAGAACVPRNAGERTTSVAAPGRCDVSVRVLRNVPGG